MLRLVKLVRVSNAFKEKETLTSLNARIRDVELSNEKRFSIFLIPQMTLTAHNILVIKMNKFLFHEQFQSS